MATLNSPSSHNYRRFRLILGRILALSLLAFLGAAPQVGCSEGWILSASPMTVLRVPAPVGDPSSMNGICVGATLPFQLFGLPWLHPKLSAGIIFYGLTIFQGAAGGGELQAGLEARFPVASWLDLMGALSARAAYYALGASWGSGFAPGVSLFAGADVRLGQIFSVGAGVHMVYDVGMYFLLRPYLSGSVHLGDRSAQYESGSPGWTGEATARTGGRRGHVPLRWGVSGVLQVLRGSSLRFNRDIQQGDDHLE
jgi:hypothetical protein